MLRERSVAALLTLLYLAAWDLPRLSPLAALGSLGLVALGWVILIVVESVLRKIPTGAVSYPLARGIVLGAVAVGPLALGLARWLGAQGEIGWWAPVSFAVVAGCSGLAFLLDRRLGGPARATPMGWIWAGAVVLSAFFAVHEALDTLIVGAAGTGKLHVALYCGTWLASLALIVAMAGRLGQQSTGVPIQVATLVLGLAMLEADRRFLVGLYRPMHLWLGALGALCLDTAISPLVVRAPLKARRVAGPIAAGMLVVTAAGGLALVGKLADPVLRSELDQSRLGAAVLAVLPEPAALRAGRARVSDPALRFERFLDEPPPRRDLNLLLVTIDTLRADQVGPTGTPNRLAPNLEALARRSVRFRRAYAQGTRTAVAMSALLLGRYAAHLQWELWPYRGRRLFDPRSTPPDRIAALGSSLRWSGIPRVPEGALLSERLDAAGLWTAACPFVGTNEFFRPAVGLARGYDRFRDLSRKNWQPPSSGRVVDVAIDLLRDAAGRPGRWFLWVHLYDPHEADGKRDRYDELVRETDSALGRLLEALDGRPDVSARTAIALLADHGEAFGEHGSGRHGSSLYDEQLRIPLVVHIPGIEPRDEKQPVAAIDVHATLLVLAGARTDGIDGVNLLPLIVRREYPRERAIFIENLKYGGHSMARALDQKGVIVGNLKLWFDRLKGTSQLHDLRRDPRERTNLISRRPRTAARLRAILDDFVAQAERSHPLP